MKCDRVQFTGGVAIVCSRGSRSRKQCSVPGCGKRVERECDAPVFRGSRYQPATCDRALCATCAVRIGVSRDGDSVDFCPPHAREWREKPAVTVRDVLPVVRSLLKLGRTGFLDTASEETPFVVRIARDRTIPVRMQRLQSPSCIGARSPIAIGEAVAKIVDLVLGEEPDDTRDERTIVVVQSAPIEIEPVGPDCWTFHLRIGVGREPTE